MKKSFILYCDQYNPIKSLSKQQKGVLLDAIFLYNCDLDYKISDPIVDMAFSFFRETFERDSIKYQTKCEKNRANANKRWHANASKRNQTDANHADSDSDSGSDLKEAPKQ